MSWLLIILIVTIICLLNRGPSERELRRERGKRTTSQDRDEIDRLQARVTVLEEILLDRDRRLRDDFRRI